MTYETPHQSDPVELPPLPQLQAPRKRWWPVPVALVGGIALGVGVAVPVTLAATGQFDQSSQALVDAVEVCGGEFSGVSLLDEGQSLSLDTKGEEDSSGATFFDVMCILNNLDIPDRVVANIDNTRALDGKQTDSWDGYAITWSYHPNTGMSAIVTVDNG